jgi:hypothetical protein
MVDKVQKLVAESSTGLNDLGIHVIIMDRQPIIYLYSLTRDILLGQSAIFSYYMM